MASSTRNQRKAARRAARNGVPPKKPLVSSQAMRTLEAFAFDKDVTRFLDSEKPCPYCGAGLRTTHSVEERAAQPGAFTVCIKCAGLSRFDEQGMHLFTLVATERYAAKALALKPLQTEPEHWHPPVGEDPGVDPGVEGLHPPIEHLREARDGGDVGHR